MNLSTIFLCIVTTLLSFSSLSMEAEKEDLYLIVGSVRVNQASGPVLARMLHDGEDLDCTHKQTWEGKATTFDLLPARNSCGPHIVGDATTYDFTRYNIKKVYIERLFTLGDEAVLGENGNLIGAVIKNLKNNMESGATLEIELDPCYSFRSHFEDELMNEADLDVLRRANPFHGWHHYIMNYAFIFVIYRNK
jgi:hypothetical protein